MHIRVTQFSSAPGAFSSQEKRQMVDNLHNALVERNGFRGATFFSAEDDTQHGSVVLWETREDAEAAAESLYPVLEKTLDGRVTQRPLNPLFEVVEPSKTAETRR